MSDNPNTEAALQANRDRIKHRLIVLSGKGGVGKSTVAVNLAYGLALMGRSVGLLDIDIHGPSLVKMLGVEGRQPPTNEDGNPIPVRVHDNMHLVSIASMLPGPDEPVIWRGPLKMGLIKQFLSDIVWPEIDYLIIDCPPGTGDEPLSVVQILERLDGSVIVSTPQDVAFLDARKTIKFSQKMNVPVLGIVENMTGFACPHCGETINLFEGDGAQKAAADFNLSILGQIPIDANIARTGDAGRPYIYDFGNMEGAKTMKKIAETILETVEGDKK
ncbi:MAG: Mrp/NBP35 family ATP-binding protein [Candidatus Cloacimonetes bacterium]|nr:Mrp/NBP35 family ATP-binding protein [Candidatus Cloacimonadota bacterium]